MAAANENPAAAKPRADGKSRDGEADRARGALYGLAIGDALGMPTQMLSRAQVTERWGPLLPGFEPAPPGHPIAAGMPAGAVTDDTEQAVLLGRLVARGPVDPRELATALVDWERDMAARGSLDLLGPSTKRAVSAVLAGTPPLEAGRTGDTNGAAMRIAPVGIATGLSDPGTGDLTALDVLVSAVQEASLVTHNTSVALAGASAVAAAVSAGVSGALGRAGSAAGAIAAVTEVAARAAELGAQRGHWVAGADVAARIRWAAGLTAGRPEQEAAAVIYSLVGTSLATQESVPAAFAVLSAVPDDPWRACLLAASLGGDCDTIGAMAGAVAGAVHGLSAFPAEAVVTIDAHGLGLPALAGALLARRREAAAR